MCKKFVSLVCLVLVLGLAGSASAALMAHWKFNNNLTDSVGTLTWTANGGAAFSTEAKEGSHSLSLDGVDDYVSVTPTGPLLVPFSTKTVTLWFKANSTTGTQVLFDEGGYNNGLGIRLNNGQLEVAAQDNNVLFTAGTVFTSTDWTHAAVTFDNGQVTLYVSGAPMASVKASFTSIRNHTNAAGIGARAGQDAFDNGSTGHYFGGLIDDVRIYDNILSVSELVEMSGGYPKAYNPTPADGAMYEDTWVNLSWAAGSFALSHDVYLGENLDDVNNATHQSEAFRGNQAAAFYVAGFPGFAYPNGLVPGTTYYWRIDEVNSADPNSPWKGDLWSFLVPSKKAYREAPVNGSQFVPPDAVTLSWTAGLNAKLHHMYFGQDAAEVQAGTGASDKGTVTSTTYSPGPLSRGATYYWRVDEFDGAVTNTGNLWSFRTIPVIAITDPNLVGWWKLDEALGVTAADYSGHDHHGTLKGALQWAEGYDGTALQLDGSDDYVNIDGYKGILGTRALTVTAWVNTTSTTTGSIAGWGVNTANQRMELRIDVGRLRCEHQGGNVQGSTNVTDGGWHHVAATVKSNATVSYPDVKLYLDGVDDTIPTTDPDPFDTVAGNDVRIGSRPSNNDRFFTGLIDDVHIYDKELTQEEVQRVMRIDPLLAWAPSPKNGSLPDIEKTVPLSWTRGDKASQHDVYFGTDKDAVANADTSTAVVYRGRQSGTSYTPPEGVQWAGGPYYWRVDENNNDGTMTKGRLWSFTVADFRLIDDFESYGPGANEIWYAWHDGLGYGTPGTPPYFAGNGTGSAVGDETTASFTEETIIHGGDQSMPLAYDNNKQGFAKYSEVEFALTAPRDWSKYGVGELSLWFRGYPGSVGSFVEAPAGTFTMTASGVDIWGTADQFHFAYKTLTGAGSIIAKVESVQNTNAWAKAGVMIRETLDAGSKHAFACVTPANGVAFQGRTDTDTASFSTNQTGLVAPYWVKLERDAAGNFTASASANGTTWQPISTAIPQGIPMSSVVYVGLALTSHDAALTCQANFSNVTITGAVSPQWTHQDIGIASNAPEPLYVAVSNAAEPAVVVHPDPAAATLSTWTEWVIPLSAFANQGINLTNVDKVAIGLGTRGNMTTPGGSGKMYFDDIRLYQPRVVP